MMDTKRREQWRNEILNRLESLMADARQIRQLMAVRDLKQLEDKADFEAKWRRIVELFPEDFSPDRASDLARHIRFAEVHDFVDIDTIDIPAVMESVRRYGRRGEQFIAEELDRVHSGSDVSQLLHPLIRDTCAELLSSRRFDEAAIRSVRVLMDELRRLSGQDSDGDSLIRQVVGTNPGQLAFSDCRSKSSKSTTEGLRMIAQGLYKGVRNPIAHTEGQLKSPDVLQIMVTCSFLLRNLQLVESPPEDG